MPLTRPPAASGQIGLLDVIEMHLVDELANIIWRKQRIGPAESVAFYSGMGRPSPTMANVATLPPGQVKAFLSEQAGRLTKTQNLLEGDEQQARTLMHQDLSPKVDAEQLVLLGRYEAHLDRKFERILTMLITLQRARMPVETPAQLK